MSEVSGGELVVRTLLKAGTKHVYLLYGGHLQPICEAIREHGIPYVDTRNELTAGYAAEGYARATDTFGVALVSAAPGFTNVITSITNAHIDRTPVVYISTSASLGDAETNNFMSGIDPVAMVKPVTKWAHVATSTRDIPRLLAQAIRIATSQPTGPVLLDLPWDVVFGGVDEETAPIPSVNLPEGGGPLPTPESIRQTIELLVHAERPVIIAGEGATHQGVSEQLRTFVEATGIPVFTSYEGFGLIPTDHPLHGGGLLKLTEFAKTDSRPDVVLALGIRFGFMTVGPNGIVPSDAKLIHVDVDPIEIGRTREVDVSMVAGTKEVLHALNDAKGAQEWPERSDWQETLQRAKVERGERVAAEAEGREVPIPPYHAVQEISSYLGDDDIVVVDGADAHMWMAEAARVSQPGHFFSHKSFFGCLGYGIGFAMGVQTANPNKRVVCVSGDGALGFTLAEFHTLARHRLPVVVVVMNNRAWGATSHFQDMTVFGKQKEYFGVDLSGAEYHEVAQALGCFGAHVTKLEQLQPALEAAFESGRPACINVEIDVEDVAPDHRALEYLRA